MWLAGPQCAGSEALAHGHSCSTWTPPGQGSDPRPLHWQVDSYPLARGILPARGQTHVLCIGRWILIHWHVDSSRPGVRPTSSALAGGFLSTGTWNPPSQGSDPHPLHWQVDSYPLHHQGSPVNILILTFPTGVRQYHIVVLICISLLVSSIEHLFMCFLAICMINL